jgi:hypothetical protein
LIQKVSKSAANLVAKAQFHKEQQHAVWRLKVEEVGVCSLHGKYKQEHGK